MDYTGKKNLRYMTREEIAKEPHNADEIYEEFQLLWNDYYAVKAEKEALEKAIISEFKKRNLEKK